MKKRIKNTCIRILMALLMTLTAVCPAVSLQAEEVSEGQEEVMDYRIRAGNQNYANSASPVYSYFVPVGNADDSEKGGFMSVRYGMAGEKNEYRAVLVRYYDDYYKPDPERKDRAISLELPLFGGFYASNEYYFILSGRNNPNQESDRAVFNIAKYDKDWNKIDTAELKDCNTTKPFNFGTARMAAEGDYLLIRTCHEMYKSGDGRNHQANVIIQLNMETMEITASLTGIGGSGYVSHSLNQFVRIEKDQMFAVDHGDTYPRGVVLTKYADKISSGRYGSSSSVNMLPFKGSSYYTNASVGGFEISDTACLVAGNSIDQDPNSSSATRNIFVSAVNKEELKAESVHLNWLTAYTEGSVSTPHLVKINENEYFVLWQREQGVYVQRIHGNGELIEADSANEDASGPACILENLDGNLSDCAPVVVSGGSLIVWSANDKDQTAFYETNKETLETRRIESLINKRPNDSYPVSEPLPEELLAADTVDDKEPGSGAVDRPSGSSSGGSYSTMHEFFITFHANGGSIYGNSILRTSSWRLPYLPSATRDGYIFEGWYTASDGGSRVGSGTQFDQDSQLYAHWKEDPSREYTVTFDANGGTVAGGNVRNTVQRKLTDLPAAERDGYVFQGWYTADGIQVTDTYQFAADVTLRAQWRKKEYTITFDANGGTVSGDSLMVTADQKLPGFPDAVRDGYTWNGWYDSPSGGTKLSPSEVFQADSTLYAQWTKKITVKKATLQSVKSLSGGRLKVSWKRVASASGYQVAYSKYKSFPAKKTAVKQVNAAGRMKTYTVMSKGKTYYVRVRAYQKVNGRKYYGSWSKVKKVTVKK